MCLDCGLIKCVAGDRLNFAIALEKAKAAGIPCEMVIVGDDCALEEKGITGRRGIAGACMRVLVCVFVSICDCF